MTSTPQTDLRIRVLEAASSLGSTEIKISDLFQFINSNSSHQTTHAMLDRALDDLKHEGAITRRRGSISTTGTMPKAPSSEMKDTSPGQWEDEVEPAAAINWASRELKGKVQGRWSDNKWYDLTVLKQQKDGSYNCLFKTTGKEAYMPGSRMRIKSDAPADPEPQRFGSAEDLQRHIETYSDHVITEHKPDTIIMDAALDAL